jgi:hypothetical protein
MHRIKGGRLLPNQRIVPPGKSMRGHAVFEVPQQAVIKTLRVKIGPGLPTDVKFEIAKG